MRRHRHTANVRKCCTSTIAAALVSCWGACRVLSRTCGVQGSHPPARAHHRPHLHAALGDRVVAIECAVPARRWVHPLCTAQMHAAACAACSLHAAGLSGPTPPAHAVTPACVRLTVAVCRAGSAALAASDGGAQQLQPAGDNPACPRGRDTAGVGAAWRDCALRLGMRSAVRWSVAPWRLRAAVVCCLDARHMLQLAGCPSCVFWRPLHRASYMQYVSCCTLHTACGMLDVACCIL